MLKLPVMLQELLDAGRWPRDFAEANAQNLRSLVASELIQKLAPDESRLFLLPPPFRTIEDQIAENPFWTSPQADPQGIDPKLALDIGDFGLGSDAPIVLDYRENPANPCVMRLRWAPNTVANRWVLMAKDFNHFIETLEL